MRCMSDTAEIVSRDISGCETVYAQSDEISFLLTDYRELETQPWFDYNISKVISMVSSMVTAIFNSRWRLMWMERFDHHPKEPQLALFDARAFSIPKTDVLNYCLWRMKDWERNSLTMYAGSFFSHKQLHKKIEKINMKCFMELEKTGLQI